MDTDARAPVTSPAPAPAAVTATATAARRPPARAALAKAPPCTPAAGLAGISTGHRVTVAGLVILRQRPGTARGVIFLTLEDETGVINVIIWRKLYEPFRRAIIAGRLLRITGRVQHEGAVTHLIAERIEDISDMLDLLLQDPAVLTPAGRR
jgi:single-strand DNA-binding protein